MCVWVCNFVVVDLAVEGRTEVPNVDFAGLLLFMKQRNTIGLPRCWPDLGYVGFAASTVIGKNIVVYDSLGHLLQAYRPFEGTAEQTVHLCFNGTNHFDFYDMSGTYNNEAYRVMRAKATAASMKANATAAAAARASSSRKSKASIKARGL